MSTKAFFGRDWDDDGNGLKKDVNEAVEWYQKAVERGNARAMYNLGACYERGEGVNMDLDEALKFYGQAAELGHEGAIKMIGDLRRRP